MDAKLLLEKDIELNKYIKECIERTGIRIRVPIVKNKRLKTTLGYCKYQPIRRRNGEKKLATIKEIDLNYNFFVQSPMDEIKKVFAHEYAHYCTLIEFGIHDHSNPVFKKYCEILEIDDSKTTTTSVYKVNRKIYEVYCSCCHKKLASFSSKNHNLYKKTSSYRSICCKSDIYIKEPK